MLQLHFKEKKKKTDTILLAVVLENEADSQ